MSPSNRGGQLAPGTGPAVASWSQGRLDVFAEGTNGALWHKWWNGAKWSGWEALGGQLTASPAATSGFGNTTPSSTGGISVYVRSTDGACWYKVWSGSAWSSWKSLGGQLAPNTGPAISNDGWLIVQGTNHQLWQMGASGWASILAPPEALSAASPGAVCTIVNEHTLVCVSTTSGNIWCSADSLGNWNSWGSVGSPP